MRSLPCLVPTLALLASLACVPAFAAESYQGCTGFINAIPATITSSGTWCLRTNFSTSMTSGAAVTVNANDVTIDGNGFYLNAIEAGTSGWSVSPTSARGIYALNRINVSVRDVRVRGFHVGIQLSGGAGHLVEDNQLTFNRFMGINVTGDANVVRDNRVENTGRAIGQMYAYGIYAQADVIDNFVLYVRGGTDVSPRGIYMSGVGTTARGNYVREVIATGAGNAKALWAGGERQSVIKNQVAGWGGWGIVGSGEASTFCRGNDVVSFTYAVVDCDVSSGDNYEY